LSSPHEVELKLEVEPSFAGALRAHPALSGAPERVEQVSVYYDTPKGALRKAGYTLRVRRSGGRFVQTVKGAVAGAGLFDRPEWESEIRGPGPDSEAIAATPLRGVLSARTESRLAPVVTSTVDRTIWMLREGKSRLELVLDEGTIRAGGAECRLCEAEIELKSGKPAAALDLARRLSEDLPLRIGVLTKAERGFALAAGKLDKAAKAAPVALGPEMNAADGFAAIVLACIRQFRLNEPLVARRRDPAALHQARVAMRRLRSAFSLFGSAIVDSKFAGLREESRWFAGRLGEARNFDVFLAGAGAEHGERREALQAARERAYDEAIAALQSKRFRTLMLDLVAWIENGAWRRGRKAKAPLAGLVARRLDRRWQKVSEGGVRLADLDEEQRHRLRIDVKKLRYALEFTAGLHQADASAAAFGRALQAMQESLGHLNDMATAQSLLAAIGEGGEGALMHDPVAERRHLARAGRQFAKLVGIGAYWQAG
jgi:inorganic triphosphatase YgiF